MHNIFTHGERVECPDCPGVERGVGKARRSVKPFLEVVQQNYSGCSVDFGVCPDCGKAWQISFTIKSMDRAPDWDSKPRDFEEDKKLAAEAMKHRMANARAVFENEIAEIEKERKRIAALKGGQ